MYGAFDVVLYFVNPTVLVANKLTSYLILSYLIYLAESKPIGGIVPFGQSTSCSDGEMA